jgi:hypothetical protein
MSSETQTTFPKKYGRTLLFKAVNNFNLTNDFFTQFEGVVSCTQSKTSGTFFVLFDTFENAAKSCAEAADSKDVLVKYSYYRVFFTMNGLNNESDYNQVKESFVQYLEQTTKSNVLFFKLYRKNNQYIGCGDFTLDTLDGMNVLLDKNTGLKSYVLNDLSGKFFRYNATKNRSLESTL